MSDTTNAGPVQPFVRRGCKDLDPSWPDIDGKPRGPRLCVSYPKCECGAEDSARNAGPVLPELSGQPRMGIALFDEHGNGADDRVLDYGRQYAEHVAGPLRERVKELERELHRQRELYTGASAAADIYEAKYDRLRAECVIEWEPGRSYTAAELLRRAIRGIRSRRNLALWPEVEILCNVGSTVSRHLCRWAGRDPDTGADLKETK